MDAAGQPLPISRLQAVDPEKGQRAVPNPNSGLVWEYTKADRNSDGRIDFEETLHRTHANVAIKNNLLVVADFSGLVHCMDAQTGKLHWTHDCLAAVYASPLIVGDQVYVADDDNKITIFRLSAEPHPPLAEIKMDSSIFTSPIFANGVLYVASNYNLFAIAAEKATD